MYAHDVSKSPNKFGAGGKKPPMQASIVKEEDQKVDNFTSISNVRKTGDKSRERPRIDQKSKAGLRKKNLPPGIPNHLNPHKNNMQLETLD